ncbi:MAG: HAD-superfamily hydrolase, subfamily variant 3 [Nocardioidaceae bacterium]|nr:HAD-superfamily hydrolase, subfamily variant 3 [Nocardioidaceae bacterium]
MDHAKGLLLDIGGVILRSGRELLLARTLGEPALHDFVRRTDLAGAGDVRWQAMLRHEITERAYWEEVAGEIGRELGESGWVTRDLIVWLYHSPETEWLLDDMIALMNQVRDAGLRLAALTNDMLDFHGQDWVDRQRWLDLFDVVVDASTTGVLKPDPGAYRLAIEAMGLEPGEIVYLDDMPVNVRGGAAAGLQAVEVLYDDRSHAMAEARRRLGLTSVPA